MRERLLGIGCISIYLDISFKKILFSWNFLNSIIIIIRYQMAICQTWEMLHHYSQWKSITNPEDLMTVVVYHVQHLAPSNSVCRGALIVFPGSNVYQGTLVVFPGSIFSWGTLLVFPDTNICSKILLHTILWGNDQKFGKTPNFFKSLKRSGSGKV